MGRAKPVDIGNGRLVASLAAGAPALLSVLVYQPEHGVAELSALPAFDERGRGDPAAVRSYRLSMTEDRYACLTLQTADGEPARADRLDLSDPARPTWHGQIGPASLFADASADPDAILVTWHISQVADRDLPALRLRFGGRLNRPALAEITETDPPAETGAVTTLAAAGPRLRIDSSLPAALLLETSVGEWRVNGDSALVDLPPLAGTMRTISVRITGQNLPAAALRARSRSGLPDAAAPIVDRALAYVRGCTALATARDECVILTDHRLLPLSWTRDAYYQALMLLATGEPEDADLVADHLRWLWRRCQRPDGRWLRSHYANGRPKDRAFQADQQLYPFLELTDYWRARAALPAGVGWAVQFDRSWRAVQSQIDPDTGLLATAENAADDPVAAPFVAAAQILLWFTALRLAELAEGGALPIGAAELRAVADRTRRAFDTHLLAGDRWLYATDARGTHVDYHDANDLPVALAPLFGFCGADDPAWLATMAFAFSAANPGYFAGPRGGLGSIHTPAPWTLGDVQAWIVARTTGDARAMAGADDRLYDAAFHDGMLPEAYSATLEPDVRIRHWFAWPGAAYAALRLLDERGELDRLRPAP